VATRGLALLVADLLVRNRYREALRAAGYTTVERDGLQAVAEIAAHQPTLIVLTSNAAGGDAATFCESVSADPAVNGARLAVLTQPPHRPALNARLRAVGVRLIRMPCTPARLQHLVSAEPAGSGAWQNNATRFSTRTIRTATPPKAPPQCWCPACGLSLEYEVSYIGGIPGRSPSQWDYFRCAQCGPFCYRHGTHRSALRAVTEEVTGTRGASRGQR
jgi:CheY-like chemotaxis protein